MASFAKKCNIVCAGDLRNLITIQQRDLKSPTMGVDYNEVYTALDDVWAAVATMSTEQIFSQTNRDEKITHIFMIRFRTDITVDNWILFESERYNIVGTRDPDFGKKRFLELSCFSKGNFVEESSKW